MKVFETKIYLRFLSWFIAVAILPLIALFTSVYLFNPDLLKSTLSDTRDTVLFAVFVSSALILILALIATRLLSKFITKPIKISVSELSKVVGTLFKTIQELSEISQNNSDLLSALKESSKTQQAGIKKGSKAVVEIAESLNQVAQKTKSTATKSVAVDKLANQSEDKSEESLASLEVVKKLLTENQKLSQALSLYADDVKDVSSRVAALAETAKFVSLNISIEASKRSFSEEFSDLVSQIRQLNITSEQAAKSITSLASSMQKQLSQSSESSEHQGKETDNTIKVVKQTVSFLNKIASNVVQISKNIKIVNKETQDIKEDSLDIKDMIKNIDKEAKSLVSHVDTVSQTINKQLTITRSLNRSSASLNSVTTALNDLVGEK